MGKYEGLSVYAESNAIRQIKAGSSSAASAAFSKLETAYTPLITSIALRVRCDAGTKAEVVQDLRIALFKAVQKYDSKRGVPFAAFAQNSLEWAFIGIRKAVIEEQQRQQKFISLDTLLEDNESTDDLDSLADPLAQDAINSASYASERRTAVGRFFAALSPSQSEVARRLYVLGESMSEVAAATGKSRQAVFSMNKRIVAVANVELTSVA